MKNKWYTYGLLIIMVGGLVTLAILQYNWLGSISKAEKNRLEEGLKASSENFIADFTDVFATLDKFFSIQFINAEKDFLSQTIQNYLKWQNNVSYNEVLSEVIVVDFQANGEKIFQKLNPKNGVFEKFNPDSILLSKVRGSKNKFGTPHLSIYLGEETFLKIPVQKLSEIDINQFDLAQNLFNNFNEVQTYILLRLDNSVITSKLIPEYAAKYFGGSFQDQYQLTILNTDAEPNVYFNSTDGDVPSTPDINLQIELIEPLNMFLVDGINSNNNMFASQSVDSIIMNGTIPVTTTSITMLKGFNSLNSDMILEDVKQDVKKVKEIDVDSLNTITGSSLLNMFSTSRSGWEFWVSHKEGSLSKFVQKTRNKNLAISFGILSILGLSCIIIFIFSNRSKKLADQQMMFVAGVSHELRTPLAVIRSAAENLSEGVIQNEERKKEYAKLMLKEGRRLSDMVDQIMEFSGIQSGKRIYNFSDFNIEDFITKVMDEFTPILEEQAFVIEYVNLAKSVTINGDREALFLALSNLIQNAIKFSKDQNKVIVRVDEITFKSNKALRIQVQDFGVGVPADEKEHIFKPFYRASQSVQNQIKGNGIGLNLVQKVMLAHKGSVKLKSVENEGSTFSLIIPEKQ